MGDRLTIFNQTLLDPSSRAGIGSFLRTWARVTVFASPTADLHLQLGKIPTPFGHFTERAYSDKNPLLGYPLMYHYSTTLRSNQLPADNADLILHRGQGLAGDFTGYAGGGSSVALSGLPLIYDSGQLVARLGIVPFTGALVRLSWARGAYLDSAVGDSLTSGAEVEDFHQKIAGVAVEYEILHLVVVAEWAHNRWESPFIVDAAGGAEDLEVIGGYLEARYKLAPGLFAAGRYSTLRFGDIDDGTGQGGRIGWDYDTHRLELGLGYWITDGVLAKGAVQLNDLQGTPGDDHVAGLQLTVAF